MIDFDEAYQLIQSFARANGAEHIELNEVLGRVLAENVMTDSDMPPFNRSAMDGYACRQSDLSTTQLLRIIEEIPAGTRPEKRVEEGTCAKIMTGAEVPEGADCVIKVEDTKLVSDDQVEILSKGNNSNIRHFGEDLRKGEVVIRKGTLLNKQHAGLLAMVGCINPLVFKQPKAGIISTGSELVDPDKTPPPSGIRNSNGTQLMSQLKSLNIIARDFGIIKDDKQSIKNLIEAQLNNLDILLLSGGVSMGDYDFVPEVLQELGFDIKIHKIKVRPGKPLLFAVKENRFVFGLPGNPVSTLIQFEIMIKPFLLKMMGVNEEQEWITMVMGSDLQLNAISLRYFVPVKIVSGLVYPLEYHGSGHLAAYAEADGILEVNENTDMIKKKDLVNVRPL
jgi:molybdopterin molybdotransferase